MIIHFHNCKECLCLGDKVMVRGSIVSPFVMAQVVVFMLKWWNNG